MSHVSKHRADESVLEIERTFEPVHLEAGYHEQEWGAPSTADHPLLGVHDTKFVEENLPLFVPGESTRLVERRVTITVRHLDVGPTGGPEFELEWSNGGKVTVMDEPTAFAYLDRDGATGGAVEALRERYAERRAQAELAAELEAESIPAPSEEQRRRGELVEKSPEELLAMTLEALPPGTTVTSDLLAERLRAVVQAKS